MSTLARFFTWMLLLFQTQEQHAEPLPVPPPEPLPEPELLSSPVELTPPPVEPLDEFELDLERDPPALDPATEIRKNRRYYESEHYKLQCAHFGHFYFREAILDQLARYFRLIRKMRKHDRSSYDLYKSVGAHIVSELIVSDRTLRAPNVDQLSPWWLQNRPTFGAVVFAQTETKEDKKFVGPRMLYFTKFTPSHAPIEFQRCPAGDVYTVVMFLDNDDDLTCPAAFAVHVSPDNAVTILNTKYTRRHSTRVTMHGGNKRSRYVGKGINTVTQWGIHPFYRDWASEVKKMCNYPAEYTAESFLLSWFIMAANLYEGANAAMTRIEVRKNHDVAVFGVDILRMPYFFRDRDVSAGSGNRRKKIFHIVRGHQRANGTLVRTHFRGEREFTWNGYDVRVSVPGWHHFDIADFNVPTYLYQDDEVVPEGMTTLKDQGEWMRKELLDVELDPPNKRIH